MTSLLLNVRTAAQLTGLSEKTLRARIARRTIPFKKDGKRVYFIRQQLLDFFHDRPGCSLEEARQNVEVRTT